MKLLLTCLSLFFLNYTFAQREQLMLVPFEKDGQWGYVNYDKKVIVVPQFDEAYPTYNRLGRFKKNGKYGYVDTKGNIVIKPIFDKADDFSQGHPKVDKRGKSYHIDERGKPIIKQGISCGFGWPYFRLFNDSTYTFVFKEGEKYGIRFNVPTIENGNQVVFKDSLPAIFDTIYHLKNQFLVLVKDKKYALLEYNIFYDSKESFLEKIELRHTEIKLFYNPDNKNEIHKIIGIKTGDYWGYGKVGTTFKEITPPKYLSIGPMFHNYGLVEYEKGKFGYIDSSGREYFDASSLEDE